jgi:hypothetical protein
MATDHEADATLAATVGEMRGFFEGKEAIYTEHGALRVRVSNIRCGDHGLIRADIEEIPTPGLPIWIVHRNPSETHPLRWTIATSSTPSFSFESWCSSPYIVWGVYTSPKLIEAIVQMASQFPENYNSLLRCKMITNYINDDFAARLRTLATLRQKAKPS